MKRSWRLPIALTLVAVVAAVGGFYFTTGSGRIPAPPMVVQADLDRNIRDALTAARDAVERTPTDANAWGKYGLVLHAHRFLDLADECFAVATKLNPDDARWPYFIGLHKLLSEPDTALPYLASAANLPTKNPLFQTAAKLRYADALLERQQFDAAETIYRDVLKATPNLPRAALGLGTLTMARDQPNDALGPLRIAMYDETTRKKAHTLLASAQRLRGEQKEAEFHQRQASLLPDDLPWQDPFVGEYTKYIVVRADPIAAIADLLAQGKLADAVPLLAKLYAANPDAPTAAKLGKMLVQLDRYAEAEPVLRDTLTRDATLGESAMFLGFALTQLADHLDGAAKTRQLEEAIGFFQRAIDHRPDLALAYVYQGQVQSALGNADTAIKTLEQGVTVRPDQADTHLALLVVLQKHGKLDAARARLPAAEQVIPPDNELLLALKAELLAKPR